jgi:hypothetical protein
VRRPPVLAGLIGAVALGICALGLWRSPAAAWGAYLSAYLFWLDLSLGAMGLLLVLALVGGSWGNGLRPVLQAACGALPLMAVLFLPLLVGLAHLYPWANSGALAADSLLRQQGAYLNRLRFVIRAAICFAGWCWLAQRLRAPAQPATHIAVIGALGLLISSSVAAIDWIMSLQPGFHSASFGLTQAVSAMLAALALSLALRQGRLSSQAASDAAGLLLVLALGWSYLQFMNYLTVWSADLPSETMWYLPRTQTSWRYLAAAMLALQFLLPFPLLLSARFRRSRFIPVLAMAILAGNACEACWQVAPALHPGGLTLSLYDGIALLGIGGLWTMLFLGRIPKEPTHA